MLRYKAAGEKKKDSVIILYTLCFLFVSLFVFDLFFFYHKTFIWNVDAFYQHYPLLVELKHLTGEFLKGNGFPMVSLNIGLGADTLGSLAIVLMDPFNYIAVLFPVKYLDIGYSLAVLLRMYSAGLAMAWFLKYHRFNKQLCLIGALSYAFCSWSAGVFCHGFFQLPLILFPLLILGIDKVFDGKRPYLLILAVAASLVTYIYFAYMSAIFCLIYLLLRYFTEKDFRNKGFPGFFRWIGVYAAYVGIGVLLSAPVILSVVFTLMNAGKSAGDEIEYFMTLKQWSKWLPSLITNTEITGNYSFTHVNALCVLLCPFTVLQLIRQRKSKPKISSLLFIFCFLMTAVPFWGSLMNGFSYSVGRWCYILAFFFVWATMDCMKDMGKEEMSQKREETIVLGWCSLLAVSLFFAALVSKTINGALLAEGILTILWMLLIVYVAKWRQKGVLVILVLNIISFYWIVYSPGLEGKISDFMEMGEPYRVYEQSLLRADSHIDDTDFYRVDYNEHLSYTGEKKNFVLTPANENLYWNSNTLFTYLSSLDRGLLDYNKRLANNGGYFRRTCVYSNDNRSRMNFLQGVRYYLSESKECKDYAGYGYGKKGRLKGVDIQESRFSPGLGYVYPHVIPKSEIESKGPLATEQILMQSAVVEDNDVNDITAKEAKAGDLKVDIEQLNYKISKETEIKPKNNAFEVFVFDEASRSDNGYQLLKLKIPNVKKSELYIEFKNLEKTPLTPREVADRYAEEGKTGSAMVRSYKNYYVSKKEEFFEAFVNRDNLVKRFFDAEGEPQALTDRDRYLVNLGYFDQISGDITLVFKTTGKYTYDDLNIYAVSQKHFDEQAEKLSSNRFRMTDRSPNRIYGQVNSESDGILYLSLVYHPGWHVYVDGIKTRTFKTNFCFTGVNITKGKHNIEIRYRPIGSGISKVLFLAGLCSFLICFLRYERVFSRRKKKNKKG